jgi:hypothetical protein
MGRHGLAEWRGQVTGGGPTYGPPSDASTFSARVQVGTSLEQRNDDGGADDEFRDLIRRQLL